MSSHLYEKFGLQLMCLCNTSISLSVRATYPTSYFVRRVDVPWPIFGDFWETFVSW